MTVRRTSVLFVLCLLALAPFAHAASDVVISQVYGGGGNSGAIYKNDFIEIFNRGASPVSLAGWSVQYASSAGTTWQSTPLSGTLAPGQYYLIQEAAGTGGTLNLPTPNASGSIAMSATAGKVALVASTALLSGGCPAVVDFVGFGGANCFEGAGPTPTLANTTAALRNNNGCQDTDSNSANFTVGAPLPRNTATALNVCSTPNNAPAINAPANPITTVNQGAAPFTVSLSGTDDNNVFTWSATAGSGVSAVSVTGGQGTANATFSVTLNPAFSGTATFTASLSDNVNPAVTRTVNIAVTPTVVNDPPAITPFANPVTTVAQDAAPFAVNVSGSDDNNVFTWSATTGTGVSNVSVASGQGTANATYTVTLQPGFSGTASFNAVLSDGVNPNATAAVTITVTPAPPPALDHIVMSQIYGGGGNSGATYRNDYVELYNPTTGPVDLAGWTIQYASATGTTWQAQPLGGIMLPGEYYLIALASGGAVGAFLPTANITGEINMSGTAGKVALSKSGDAFNGCPVGNANLVDLVGYGTTANCREGGTNAPAPSNTIALFRKNGGFTDTNVNGSDFQTGAPNPRRTTPIQEIGPAVLSSEPRSNGTNAPRDASISVTFTEAVDVDGSSWFDVTCATTGQHNSATLSYVSNSWTITPNVNFLAGEQCTVTIFKQFVHDTDLDDSAPNTDTLASDVTFTFTVATGAAPAYPADVHLTFGNPTDAVTDLLTPNNYLMVKPEYALSYNRDRGTPNWVSWHLADEWVGTLARVDTFRPDPAVPAEWYRVMHTDYFASGFDRGHMVPNADRDPETSTPINQATFLMSNMIPQAPDNNQGPWADMENYLRTLLPANELYIVAGGAGTGGTGSSGFMTTFANGHVTVPAQTWKVVLVLPKSAGDDVARVTAGARTIAVILPNVQGIRDNDWTNYLTTVDAVETLTGYDFFENVPDAIENAIEAGINGANPPGVANQNFSTDEDTPGAVALEAAGTGTLTYTIVSTPAHGTLSGSGANQTYTPAPDYFGADSFTFKVSNANGTSKTATVSINVVAVNDAPTANDDARTTNEDTPLSFAAYQLTSNDVAGPANESSQTMVVSSVTGNADTHGSVALVAGMITYTPAANYNGAASFTYEVCDSGSLCSTATVNVTVNAVNDAPTASLTAQGTGVEGSAVAASVSASDIDANDSATIAWSVTKNGSPFANGTGTSIAFTPDDNGSYVISTTVTDAAGATGNASSTVAVSNAAPIIVATAGPSSQLPLGSAATVSITFTDAGAADTHSAVLAWGDNSTSTAVCAAGACNASHTYAAAGLYTVAIVVSDDDGAVASSSLGTVVIYDNAGASITGGGWITTTSGKANLVVNAQYLKNAAVPTGTTRFDIAGATLVSSSYDWLVVTGTTATLQGTATINGAGNYGFAAVATDNGNNDTFRIRVWDRATNATVYDSGAAATLGGGNLTIH